MALKIIRLTPPLLSSENIKDKITCIRGHRERIFQVFKQIHTDKLVIHNYGQGGAGWTFLFGCVNKSIRLFEEELTSNLHLVNKPIVVIGAGCYGLLTAIMLKRKGYSVKIIAKEINNIASYKAAGFFFPRARKCSTPEERAIFLETGLESYKVYKDIALGLHDFMKIGVKVLPGYFGLDIDPGFGPYIDSGLMPNLERVVIDFGQKQYEVNRYKTIFINPSLMMQELNRLIIELNIVIERREISSFDEISENLIFNCSGIGSKQLANDKRIIPVQGHLILLKDQPIEELQYLINVKIVMDTPTGGFRDELIYFAPKESGILGITFIRGEDSLTANQHEFDRILRRSRDFFGFAVKVTN